SECGRGCDLVTHPRGMPPRAGTAAGRQVSRPTAVGDRTDGGGAKRHVGRLAPWMPGTGGTGSRAAAAPLVRLDILGDPIVPTSGAGGSGTSRRAPSTSPS